jgi:hypothetical protein
MRLRLRVTSYELRAPPPPNASASAHPPPFHQILKEFWKTLVKIWVSLEIRNVNSIKIKIRKFVQYTIRKFILMLDFYVDNE